MQYGKLLSRAWSIIWEHKYLILLGVLVALGSGGNGASSSGQGVQFSGDGQPSRGMPELPQIPELPAMGAVAIVLIILLIIVALAVALVFWAISTIARGGLIAGANAADEGESMGFGRAWNAGWRKGWRLLGIGILPAIPAFVLVAIALVFGLAVGGFAALRGQQLTRVPVAGLGVIVAGFACILVPVALVLGLLRTFANRACMLEDLGVIASYRRGLEVLFANLGPAIVLFLIQIGIGIVLAILGFFPGIVLVLCCILWPLLLLIQGGISAYFSTMWTLAWRNWTGLTSFEEPELATGPEGPSLETMPEESAE